MNDLLEDDLNVDLTPLIDVVFMLLIFFIMTTTFSKPVVEIMLPTAQETKELEKQDEIVIAITESGGIFYKDVSLSEGQFEALLEEHPTTRINLHVDKNAPFDSFIQVIDKAKAREGGSFVISTESAN